MCFSKSCQTVLKFLALSFFSVSALSVQAASVEDIRSDHCSDCGTIVVGGARIDAGTIQWIGSESPASLNLNSGNAAFGFTGSVAYQGEEVTGNAWQFELSTRVVMGGPKTSGAAPSIGMFFSPSLPGVYSSSNTYRGDIPLVKTVNVQGVGLADDTSNPALTLDIAVGNQTSQEACTDITSCDSVSMGIGSTLTFSVTPRVNTALLPAGSQEVKYVMVNLTAIEEDTGATSGSNLAFKDRSMANNFNASTYFQTLYPLGPNSMESSYFRTYSFLVAVNHTMTFYSKNTRSSGDGYIEYAFSIPGHYNFNDETLYPGSHKTFRVHTSGDAPIVTPTNHAPTASFSVTKLLTRTYQLDASSSTDPDSGDYVAQYNFVSSDGQTISTGSPIRTITFAQDGTYTISLTVKDSNGSNSSNTATQTIVVNNGSTSTGSLAANFTTSAQQGTAPMSLSLDASSSTTSSTASITNYSWSMSPSLSGVSFSNSAIQQISLTQAGTYSITLTVTDSTGATSSQTRTIEVLSAANDLQAYFTVEWLTPYRIRVDASGSTAAISEGRHIERYQWITSDGRQAEGVTAEIDFTEIGNYAITLTVYDNTLDVAASSKKLEVISRRSPVAQFDFTTSGSLEPVVLTLDGHRSYDPDNILDSTTTTPNGQGISAYMWTLTRSGQTVSQAHGITPNMTLTEPGVYGIQLSVIDDEGNLGTIVSTTEADFVQVGLTPDPELPLLGTAIQVTASTGESQPRDINMYAGIQDTDTRELLQAFSGTGDNAGNIFLDQGQNIRVLASIDIPADHQGMTAKRIGVLVVDLGDSVSIYRLTDIALLPFLPWELNNFTDLLPTASTSPTQVTLGETLDMELYKGTLTNSVGSYALFFGYSLDGEAFVYSATPLLFKVVGTTQ